MIACRSARVPGAVRSRCHGAAAGARDTGLGTIERGPRRPESGSEEEVLRFRCASETSRSRDREGLRKKGESGVYRSQRYSGLTRGVSFLVEQPGNADYCYAFFPLARSVDRCLTTVVHAKTACSVLNANGTRARCLFTKCAGIGRYQRRRPTVWQRRRISRGHFSAN